MPSSSGSPPNNLRRSVPCNLRCVWCGNPPATGLAALPDRATENQHKSYHPIRQKIPGQNQPHWQSTDTVRVRRANHLIRRNAIRPVSPTALVCENVLPPCCLLHPSLDKNNLSPGSDH